MPSFIQQEPNNRNDERGIIIDTAKSLTREYIVNGTTPHPIRYKLEGLVSTSSSKFAIYNSNHQQPSDEKTTERDDNNDDGNSSNSSIKVKRVEAEEDENVIAIREWADFCSTIFAYKVNPPPSSYFIRHYDADPDRLHPSLIRIARTIQDTNVGQDPGVIDTTTATDRTNDIVASCRLFYKRISNGYGSYIVAGGIGEVCTKDNHRRRGLSKQLLNDCIAIMRHNADTFHVSILHAAPSFYPVYAASGYSNFTISQNSWITVYLPELVAQASLMHSNNNTHIRLAQFPNDTIQLQLIHQEYSERRFTGCIIRSIAYWNSYISQELDGTLYVLEDRQQQQQVQGDSDDQRSILGWLSIRQRGNEGCYQVRDFGCQSIQDAPDVFRTLLHDFVKRNISNSDEISSTTTIQIQIPTPVVVDIRSGEDKFITNEIVEDDSGWMYKPIIQSLPSSGATTKNHDDDLSAICEDSLNKLLNKDCPHLIWSADGF